MIGVSLLLTSNPSRSLPQVAAFLEALERMGVHVGAVNSAEEAALTVDASDVPTFRFFRDLQHLEEAVKRREINEALWR